MENFKLPNTIIGNRLELRSRTHESDAEMWQAIEESRTELREYLFWVDSTTNLEDVVKTTDLFFRKWDDDEEWGYTLFSRTDNHLLGCLGVHNISFRNQKAEIGYWLRTSETGKGYMAEAVRLAETALFEAGMHRVEILCDVNNTRSAAVAKRCGYTLESIAKEALYHYTGLHDEALYVRFNPAH